MQIVHLHDGSAYVNRHLDLLFNKHKIVSQLQPESICEIGVRCGYSMLMFKLAVPHAKLLGIDFGKAEHGGFVGAIEHATKHVPFMLIECDSQEIEVWRYTPYQFWHIDGDHSVEGTYHDIELAFNNGAKWILVDDYGRIPETGEGTNKFLLDAWKKDTDTKITTRPLDEHQLLITRGT